jgi:hypothetical protein
MSIIIFLSRRFKPVSLGKHKDQKELKIVKSHLVLVLKDGDEYLLLALTLDGKNAFAKPVIQDCSMNLEAYY